MKHPIAAASVVALALGVAGPAAFAEQQGMQQGTQQGSQQQTGLQAGQQGEKKEVKVSDLTGTDVVNRQGEQIGDIDEIVRKSDDDEAKAHAVISVGGFLGMGDKDVLVPLDRLSMQEDKIVLPQDMASKDALERQPAWKDKEDDYEKLSDSDKVEIERSEFAAFERGQQGMTPGQQGTTGRQGTMPGQDYQQRNQQGSGAGM
jgi:sporulation protein YlmC with PRC-barrel domain